MSIVYKGPIEMDQLIEDLDLLQMPMSKRYIQGMPYLGSWFSDPPQIELRQFAEVFRKRGYIDDARIQGANKKLSNPNYTNKAPQSVVQQTRDRLADDEKQRDIIITLLEQLSSN